MSHTNHSAGELPGTDVKGCSKLRKELVRRVEKRFPKGFSVWRGTGKKTPPVFPK